MPVWGWIALGAGGVLLVAAAALAVLLVQLVERLQAERLGELGGAPAGA